MNKTEKRFITTFIFLVLVSFIAFVIYYLVSTNVTPEEMTQKENEAIQHAKYCMAMNYKPIECQ